MRLRTRLRISSAISIGSILAIGSVLAWAVRDSRRASDAEDLVTGLRQLILERGIMRDEFLLYRETRARVQWEAATARLESQLRRSTIVFEEVESRRTIDEMLRLTESGKGLFEDLVQLPDERETPPGPPSVSTALRQRIASRLLLLSYELEGHSSRLEALAAERSSTTQHRTMLLVFLLVGTCLAVFATNAVIATRLVEHRIARLQVGAERIAAGDFAHRIGFVGDDELAALGRSFDEMVERLRSITVSRDLLEAESAERMKAQEALSSTEERFRIAAETSNDVIYEWDLKERVDWFGDIDGLLGWNRGEFPRTLAGWAEFLHPEDRSAVMASIQAHLEGRAPYIVEYRMFRKDGGVRWWSARGAVARLPDGAPSRWVGTITDITERKQAEEALRESESRFRQLAESLPQLVWTCQPEGPCDYLNRQWIDFTGVPEAQQFGFGWLEQLHPDDRAPTVAAWEAAVASGANFRMEFRIRRHDGEYRWFDTQAARLLDADGHTVKWFGSNTDITERRRAEDEIRRLNAELEERVLQRTAQLEAANSELEAFSYSVSHDLRAPLRAVDGFSRILLEDLAPQLDAEGKRLLGVVRTNTRQMGQLIDDLLTFSRVGRQAMVQTAVDIASLAKAAFDDQRVAGEAVSITVGPLPPADADSSLMRQVWVNLISNALKFTRPKAERVIVIAGRAEPGRVVYSVKDNGVGFDMAYSNKLFGVFQRLHSSHEFEGTGVGLALVQRIVHRHGGEVWGEGKVGEGATFSFSLPRPGGSA